MRKGFVIRSIAVRVRRAVVCSVVTASSLLSQTPPDLKIAFIGDQGPGEDARAVLELIKEEDAQAIVHQGDFDYVRDPESWDSLITDVLGADFPCIATMGNHEVTRWDGDRGYQWYLERRLTRAGIPWEGDLGVQSCLYY